VLDSARAAQKQFDVGGRIIGRSARPPVHRQPQSVSVKCEVLSRSPIRMENVARSLDLGYGSDLCGLRCRFLRVADAEQ